jgi:hypothetical protein
MQTELVDRLPLARGERLCIVTNVEPFEMAPMRMPGEHDATFEPFADVEGHGLMGYLYGDNADGSRWIVEGPIRVSRFPV